MTPTPAPAIAGKTCRWCKKASAKYFCSPECDHAWRVYFFPAYAKEVGWRPPFTHAQGVARAARWLRRTMGCVVVMTEIGTAGEAPDVIGWRGSGGSHLVEVKISRADFHRDRRKPHRRDPGRGLGELRWYFAPRGMLEPPDLPKGWGLAEVVGRIVRRTVQPTRFDPGALGIERERCLLVSAAKRATRGAWLQVFPAPMGWEADEGDW